MIIHQIKENREGGIFTPLGRRNSPAKWTEQRQCASKRYYGQPIESRSNFKTRQFSQINNGCLFSTQSQYTHKIGCESTNKMLDHIMGEVKEHYKSQNRKKSRKERQKIVKNRSINHSNSKQQQIIYKESVSRALQKILWIQKKSLQGNDIQTPFHNRKLINLNKGKLVSQAIKNQYFQRQKISPSNKAQRDASSSEKSFKPQGKALSPSEQEFDDSYLPSQSRKLTCSKEKTKTEERNIQPSASSLGVQYQNGIITKSAKRKSLIQSNKMMFSQGVRAISARQIINFPQFQISQKEIRFSQGQEQTFDKNQCQFTNGIAIADQFQKRLMIFPRKQSNNLRREHLKQDRKSIKTHLINSLDLVINL